MTDLLTESEASELLRIKVKSLQSWRQQHRGPRYTKLGSRVFYRRSDLHAFIDAGLVETQPGRSARDERR
jgi:hypothetical protein